MTTNPFARGSAFGDQTSEPGIRITVAEIVPFLRRYTWTIAGVFLFTVLGAYVALSLTTELYDVRAALLVKLGRENLDAPPTARNAVLSAGVRREELGSEVQILQSEDLVAEVVDQIGLEAFRVIRVPPADLLGKAKFYAKAGLRWAKAQYRATLVALDLQKRLSERDTAIALLLDGLHVEPQKDSDVILLQLRLANPELAKLAEDTLIERYLARRVQVRRTSGVKEFFEREVADLRRTLQLAEAQAADWRHQSDLTLPAEQKALLLRQIRELSAQREQAASRTQALSTQVEAARTLIADAAERVRASQVELPKATARQLRDRIVTLEAERARLLITYEPGAPPVEAIEGELASVREVLAGQDGNEIGSVTTELNPARQLLEQSLNHDTVALQGLTAEGRAQEAQLTRLSDELRRLETSDSTLVQLERERQLAEQNYLAAAKRLKEADVEAELDVSRISNVTIAMRPTASLQPVYPRKLLVMALALAIGLVFGVGLAIAREWTSDTVHDPAELESTDLVCLATFGDNRKRGRSLKGAA